MINAKLLDDGEDVALTHDGQLFLVDLDLGAGVLADQHGLAGLDGHNDLVAVNHAAGADFYDLVEFGLLLRRGGEVNAALGLFFGFLLLEYETVSQRLQFHVYYLLSFIYGIKQFERVSTLYT